MRIDYKLNKIFIEIRYPEIFSLPERKYKILDNFASKFNNKYRTNSESVSFLNDNNGLQLHVQINRIIIDWDMPNGFDEFVKITKSYMNSLKSILELRDINRIGCRMYLAKSVSTPEKVDEYISSRLFSDNLLNNKIISGKINPSIGFSGHDDTNLFNLHFSYQHEQIIEGNIGSKTMEEKTNHNILLDFDYYRTKTNINKLNAFLDDLEKFNESRLYPFISSIDDVKEE